MILLSMNLQLLFLLVVPAIGTTTDASSATTGSQPHVYDDFDAMALQPRAYDESKFMALPECAQQCVNTVRREPSHQHRAASDTMANNLAHPDFLQPQLQPLLFLLLHRPEHHNSLHAVHHVKLSHAGRLARCSAIPSRDLQLPRP